MNLDYLDPDDGELEFSGRQEKLRNRRREETEFRGRKNRLSPRERIRRIRKSQARY